MKRETVRRARGDIVDLAREGLDWIAFSTAVTEVIRRAVPFQRCCWHTVDPGTVLFTGSLNQNVGCSGTWLAEHEYVIEDVNKWAFLAHSGRCAGATSLATHGDLSRSARHRSHAHLGIGDELRASFVADDSFWGAAGFLRDRGEPWFTDDEVQFLAALSEPIAAGMRRAMLVVLAPQDIAVDGPGVVVFHEDGQVEAVSPAAERWIAQIVEEPPPPTAAESKIVQAVAAQARRLRDGQDPLELTARSRVRTRSGQWLLLYGTRLSGRATGQTAVILQPATPSEITPLIGLTYALTTRELQVTQFCLQGHSTEAMARLMNVSPYTVQDHLKSTFSKTGAHSRGQLVAKVFLEHFVPRWQTVDACPPGWLALDDRHRW
jgi:DNA-binding CsgD family transcriptional regulator